MLKLKYLFENFELARKCLELYEYDKESIGDRLKEYDAPEQVKAEFTSVRVKLEQLNSLPLMRRLVHLQEYATLLYVMSEPVAEKPDWMNGLTDKLNFKLRQLEKSLEGN